MQKTYDLNERLTNFGVSIICLSEKIPQTFAGQHLAGQIIRSGTAPALHYGEAQAGESKRDFLHKMKTALKELRETLNALDMIKKLNWVEPDTLNPVIDENIQLISIFVSSIKTTIRNLEKVRE